MHAESVNGPLKFRWAPKVRPEKVRRLYAAEAAGLLDGALVDDVGMTLLLRCRSILSVTRGLAPCPHCGAQMSFATMNATPSEPVACPGCGWEASWYEFHASWRHRELHGGAAVYAFSTFTEAYPRARTAQEKLLCIDRLIHAFHLSVRGTSTRSAGVNLIEGSKQQVLQLLDEIAGGGAVTPKRAAEAQQCKAV